MSAIAIGLLILTHAADYVTFLAMIMQHGLSAEANPIVVAIARNHGLLVLTIAKTSTVLLVASLFLVVMRTRPRLAGGVLAVGVVLGGVGALSNLATI
jgi:hypothetical protein